MSKQIKRVSFLITLLVVFFSLSFFIKTVQATETAPTKQSQAIVVADVNIYNAKIDKQDNNQLTISFQLSNGKKVQPDVHYAVSLTQENEKGDQLLTDNHIYPEVVNLGENQKVDKVIKYTAPTYLDGEYSVWINSANTAGMPYASAYLGTIKLQKKEAFIEIDPTACYLKVNQEEKKYFLGQGVDVKPEEQLWAFCSVTNHFDADKTLTPRFTTKLRSSFGKILETKDLSTPITLKKEEKKEIKLLIPKVTDPQAYDATLSLVENNKVISSSATFHYVIVGESATIQNVRLDKVTYQKGEKANLSFFWTGRADNFSDARYSNNQENLQAPKVTATILNQDNKACSNLFTQALNSKSIDDSNLTLTIPITQACLGAQAEVKILDKNGKVLAEKKVSSPKVIHKITKPIKKSAKSSSQGLFWLIIVILIIVGLVWLIVHYLKKDKGGHFPGSSPKVLLFLAVLLGTMFLLGNSAQALTFTVPGGYRTDSNGNQGHYFDSATYSVNMNKSHYAPSEMATMTGWTIDHSDCLNAVTFAWLDGGGIGGSPTQTILSHDDYQHDFRHGHITHAVENTPGSHNAWATGYAVSRTSSSPHVTVHFPYTVVGPPTPTVSLTASPNPVAYNASSNITWTTTNASSCQATGNWSGSKNKNGGTESTGNLTSSKTYSIECWNSSGASSGVKSVTANVMPPPLASCGGNVQTYSFSTDHWPSTSPSAFCSSGTPNPANPTFPSPGATTIWTCTGSINTVSCHAPRQSSFTTGVWKEVSP